MRTPSAIADVHSERMKTKEVTNAHLVADAIRYDGSIVVILQDSTDNCLLIHVVDDESTR